MPRKSKGPRLYFRKAKGPRKAVYVIRDGTNEFSTGTDDSGAAEKALRIYLADKERPVTSDAELMVADVLRIYGEKHAIKTANPERIGYAISALLNWWSPRTVDEVSAATTEAYAEDRRKGYLPHGADTPTRPVSDGTIRRELGCLRSALNYCQEYGYLSAVPAVILPDRPPPKDRYLERDEVASLIRAARHDRRTRYLAKFILVALYTGSRKTDVLSARYAPHATGGHMDLKRGRFHRKPAGKKVTKKRAPPVSLPPLLHAHLTRWHANGSKWVVEIDGAGVVNIKNDWDTVRHRAGIPDVTPHTLRHTAITWAMQAGANIWHVSGFFGVSLDTLQRVYAHHHPDHMFTAVDAANQMGKAAA